MLSSYSILYFNWGDSLATLIFLRMLLCIVIKSWLSFCLSLGSKTINISLILQRRGDTIPTIFLRLADIKIFSLLPLHKSIFSFSPSKMKTQKAARIFLIRTALVTFTRYNLSHPSEILYLIVAKQDIQ